MEWTILLLLSMPPSLLEIIVLQLIIPVITDDIVEGTEMFNLKVIVPSSENDTILGKQNTAIVYIYDSTG